MRIHGGAVLLKPSQDVANQIKDVIPRAASGIVNGALTVAVKHKLEETLVLRNMGFDVPSPINYGWGYPGMYKPRDNQYHTAAFATLFRRAFILNEMRCVDAETEYLSPTGWRRMADYDGGMVAQYDKDTEQASFVQPTEYIKKPMPEGEQMIRFKTVKGIDQLLTQNHRVLYVSSTGAKQVADAGAIERANAAAARGWSGRFITTFDMQTETRLEIDEHNLRVMVAVIADGHFGSNTTRCVVRLKKVRKLNRLQDLLWIAGIPYRVKEDLSETGKGFYVITFNAPMRHKDFSQYWGASKEQLAVIANEVKYWDSAEGKEDREGTFRFSSFVKESADFVQYACAATGRTCSLRTYTRDRTDEGRGVDTEYVVFVREKAALLYLKAATSDGENINNISREPSPDGYCYCFAVPKTFIVMRRNGCVFITGNTGKTGASLWAAEYLLQEGFIRRVLIVCPKSCMRDVWEQTLFECLPHRGVSIMYGDKDRRLKMMNKGAEFCIINHDGIATLATKQKMKHGKKEIVLVKCDALKDQFDLIIYDEADVLCNHRNILYKALASIITPTTWLWLMTGTPIPNNYADAWGLLCLIRGKDIPYKSYTRFKEAVMFKISPFKYANKDVGKAILYDLMQPAIRFKQEECFDLPKVQELWRTAELSKEQKVAYWQMQKSGVLDRGDANVFALNAAVKMSKLLQISCGSVKDDQGNKVSIDASPRLQTLVEVLHESGVRPGNPDSKKAVAFMPFKHTMDDVVAYLESLGFTPRLVNGDVSMGARKEIFDCFKTGGCDVLVAHPEVTAHGLDLTVAKTLIWYAPCFGNRLYAQGNMRHQGEKQKDFPAIVHITATRLEKERFAALRKAGMSQAELLDMYSRALDEDIESVVS